MDTQFPNAWAGLARQGETKMKEFPQFPEADFGDGARYVEADVRDYGSQMYNYGAAQTVSEAIKGNERSVMRLLADRIAGNAHPEEDGRLEVAYAIARYLGLDWPAAKLQP